MEIESFYYSQFNDRDTVLIVDDAEVNREILKLIFEDKYRTLEAADGVEGLALLRQYENQVCMILLDVVMPKMDGLEFLEHFSKLELQNQIPVFLITADGSDQVTRRAYEMGVMDVIQKPIVPYVVKRRVDSVVELFCARACLNMRVHEQQLELLRQAEKIIELNKGIIEALATAIEFRSGESGEHVHRIHDITEILLRETSLGAGLSGEEITQIALGSIMHDIGKIAIPDAY